MTLGDWLVLCKYSAHVSFAQVVGETTNKNIRAIFVLGMPRGFLGEPLGYFSIIQLLDIFNLATANPDQTKKSLNGWLTSSVDQFPAALNPCNKNGAFPHCNYQTIFGRRREIKDIL